MKPERKGGYGLVLNVAATSIGGIALTIQYIDESTPATVLIGPSLCERVDFEFDTLKDRVVFLEYDQLIEGTTTYVTKEGETRTHRTTAKNAVVTSELFKPLDESDPIAIKVRVKMDMILLKLTMSTRVNDEQLAAELEELKSLAKSKADPKTLAKIEELEKRLANADVVKVVDEEGLPY